MDEPFNMLNEEKVTTDHMLYDAILHEMSRLDKSTDGNRLGVCWGGGGREMDYKVS